MSLSIIIRKKDTYKVPIKLSVQQLNRYAWRKYVHRRKLSAWQKFKRFNRQFWGLKRSYTVEKPLAMF